MKHPEFLENLFLKLPVNLYQVIGAINKNGHGLVFLIDDDKRLLASLSDGDVRRALLAGNKLDELVERTTSFLNLNPKFLPLNSKISEIWDAFNEGYSCIPLVNQKGEAVDIATPRRIRYFPVLEPNIGQEEINNVLDCLTSGWISSQGKYIQDFERAFEDYSGGGFAVAVANGTVALELALKAYGIGLGDEVIVPNFTFAASINAIINVGAIPVLVDIEQDSWTINPSHVLKSLTEKTKAIMPVHIYGQPCRMDELSHIGNKNGLKIIADSAEALGATYKGRGIGLEGDCSCFSFFANKLIS
jgi:perosamine synthetase